MKHYVVGFVTVFLSFTSVSISAADVHQLLFRWPRPANDQTCYLRDLDAIKNAPFPGVIGRDSPYPELICKVNIPRKQFDDLYRYCSLAFVEATAGHHVCGVAHFTERVEFSYGYPDGATEPTCMFVCIHK